MQNKRQNLSKPEQSVKTFFSKALTGLRLKNAELTKNAYIYQEYAQKMADLNHVSIMFQISYSEQQKSILALSSQYSIILTLESLAQQYEKVRIQRSCYRIRQAP